MSIGVGAAAIFLGSKAVDKANFVSVTLQELRVKRKLEKCVKVM